MSPLHAPGATRAHPVFVNTACKERGCHQSVKVSSQDQRQCKSDGGAAGPIPGWTCLRHSLVPCSCGAQRASFTWSCQRRKTQEFVFIYLHLLFSPLFSFFVLFCVCVLKWMTSLLKHGRWCLRLEKQNSETVADGCFEGLKHLQMCSWEGQELCDICSCP